MVPHIHSDGNHWTLPFATIASVTVQNLVGDGFRDKIRACSIMSKIQNGDFARLLL